MLTYFVKIVTNLYNFCIIAKLFFKKIKSGKKYAEQEKFKKSGIVIYFNSFCFFMSKYFCYKQR